MIYESIALGGAGAMTQIAVKDLAGKKGVKELVIADYNIGAAEHLPEDWGIVFGKKIDANNMRNWLMRFRL